MTRETVASVKGRSNGGTQSEPRPGTALREFYDAIFANRGDLTRLVPMNQFVGSRGTTAHLRDDYLLDIRATGGRKGGCCLVGRWEGDHYIDYVAERLGL